MDYQNGDVKLIITKEGFDIDLKDNFVEMTSGQKSILGK